MTATRRRANALPSRSAGIGPLELGSSAALGNTKAVLRGIACFETFKGLVALAAALGLLGFVHQDLRHGAGALIGHVGLRPDGHFPTLFLGELDRWFSADLRPLLLAAAGYVGLRFTEAYGLWHARPWGEWLGALSGALYVPFELQHLIHRPRATIAAAVIANLAVVGLLVWRLWRRRSVARRLRQYSVSTSLARR